MIEEEHESKLHPLLTNALALQQAGQYVQAVESLVSQDSYIYEIINLHNFYDLLANFPQAWRNTTVDQPAESPMNPTAIQNPSSATDQPIDPLMISSPAVTAGFHYLQAIWSRRNGQLLQASWHLSKAKLAYTACDQPYGVVRTTLALAQLVQPQEGWPPAHRYLFDEVQPFFDLHLVDDPTLQAHCYLQMADVARDQGDWATGVRYARQALTQYGALAHAYGQVMAHIWLVPYALSSGDLAGAKAHLQQAHEQAAGGQLGQIIAARLLYGELLVAWYQRSLATALPLAQQYLAAANAEAYSLEQIEARLLLGNLYRDSGEYHTAHSWYDDVGAVIEQLGYRASFVTG